jgi:hypothetical protein
MFDLRFKETLKDADGLGGWNMYKRMRHSDSVSASFENRNRTFTH